MSAPACHPERPRYCKGLCKPCYAEGLRRAKGILPRQTRTLAERFWPRVDRSLGPDACWPHLFPKERVHISGKRSMSPRRVAWLLTHGAEAPRQQHVEVSCRNPKCCNPKHLLSPRIEDRFWRYVRRGLPGECWEWQSTRTKRNYGQYRDRSRFSCSVFAHRYAYELGNGLEPGTIIGDPQKVVMHLCDNPPCCNPAHLRLGTHKDNHDDMMAKGRHSHGERHAAIMRAAREEAHRTTQARNGGDK